MLDDLFPEERRQEILKQVSQSGRVSVGDLSRRFRVSEVTIRTDLQALVERNLVVRTHGGAVVATAAGAIPLVPSLASRLLEQPAEKERIGEAAAAMVENGDAIILDSSSTCLAIAQRLKNHRDLTVVTNSLAIAQEMLDGPGVTVVMPGGTLRRETASLVGPDGVDFLRKYNIRKGFFGAHGLTLAEGLTDVSAPEAEVKRPLVALCRHRIAVLDATKWGRVGLASFASITDFQIVITDTQAPADLLRRIGDLGIEVIVV
jgi:DeoR/GlpR family transcriptional regulator of sugar metabolism